MPNLMNNTYMKHILLSLLVLPLLLACGPSKKSSPEEQARLRQTYDSLYKEVNQNWRVMMDDDNEKIFYMKRLLDEITYTNEFDSVLIDSLRYSIVNLQALRYDSLSMADSDRIDAYDDATSQLSAAIRMTAKNHPEYESYPLMEELTLDILEANDRILLHRIRYDQAAREYNAFMEQNLDDLDPAVATKRPQKFPVFSLSGE